MTFSFNSEFFSRLSCLKISGYYFAEVTLLELYLCGGFRKDGVPEIILFENLRYRGDNWLSVPFCEWLVCF